MAALICEREPNQQAANRGAALMRAGPVRCLIDLGLPCNVTCTHCPRLAGQTPASGKLVRAMQKELLARARRLGGERLVLGIFGGEPLLRLDLVNALARETRRAAQAAGMGCDVLLATNGTLLDKGTARALAASGVSAAQVTLAGPARLHDRARRLASGGPTFDRIVGNLLRARERLRVVIRVEDSALLPTDADDLLESLERAGLFDPPCSVLLHLRRPAPYEEQLRALSRLLSEDAPAGARMSARESLPPSRAAAGEERRAPRSTVSCSAPITGSPDGRVGPRLGGQPEPRTGQAPNRAITIGDERLRKPGTMSRSDDGIRGRL